MDSFRQNCQKELFNLEVNSLPTVSWVTKDLTLIKPVFISQGLRLWTNRPTRRNLYPHLSNIDNNKQDTNITVSMFSLWHGLRIRALCYHALYTLKLERFEYYVQSVMKLRIFWTVIFTNLIRNGWSLQVFSVL